MQLHAFNASLSLQVRSDQRKMVARCRRPSTSEHFPPVQRLSASTSLQPLVNYLAAQNIVMPFAKLTGSGENRHLRATELISPGSLLVRVPAEAGISAHCDPGSRWWHGLVSALLRENALGAESKWASYIESLPERPSGVAWACFECGVENVAAGLRRVGMAGDVWKLWGELGAVFDEGRGNEIPNQCSWEDFLWAVGTVQSRAFRVDAPPEGSAEWDAESVGTCALLPGLDLLNHSTICKTNFTVNAQANGAFDIKTGMGFETDEELLVSYGTKANDSFIFFYGFVEGNNPGDCVSVSASSVLRRVVAGNPASALLLGKRRRILSDAGLMDAPSTSSASATQLKYTIRRDSIDDSLLAALRVCFASEEELNALDTVMLGTEKGRRHAISLRNELQVWESIGFHCERMLAAAPSFSKSVKAEADELRSKTICSAVWKWGVASRGSVAEAVYFAERAEILRATVDRVRHFAHVSKAIGRPITILLPPSQNMVAAQAFGLSTREDRSGVGRFET
jgi:hypothetical protein